MARAGARAHQNHEMNGTINGTFLEEVTQERVPGFIIHTGRLEKQVVYTVYIFKTASIGTVIIQTAFRI